MPLQTSSNTNSTELANVLPTLQNLIAPGRQMRLSPYIQDAQAALVFAKQEDLRGQGWLTPDNEAVLQTLAERWLKHLVDGGSAHSGIYDQSDETLFRAALIENASRLIPQLQLVLLDLISTNSFPKHMNICATGETAGIHAVAILDFLLALQDACDLHSVEYPFKQVQLTLIPTGHYSEKYGAAFIKAFEKSVVPRSLNIPIQWSQDIPSNTDLAICFADLRYDELDKLLPIVFNEAVVVVLERGTQDDAKELMRWRHDFLSKNTSFRTLGPCGSEFGKQLPKHCLSCAPRRFERFHYSSLYRVFFEAINALLPTYQIPSEKLKELLEWSYVIIQGQLETKTEKIENPRLPLDVRQPATLRYIRALTKDEGKIEYERDQLSGDEYIVMCPAYQDRDGLAVLKKPGEFFPDMQFGDLFTLQNYRIEDKGKWSEIRLTPESQFKTSIATGSGFIKNYNERTDQALDRCAHRLFGFKQGLYPFQHRVIEQALTGNHILGIAATGGGKSECFILPAMLLPGITIVVSPLKSLMQDQIEQRLKNRYGLGYVSTYINGDIKFQERQARLKRMELGEYKLIYFTPEQLERSYVLESLRRANQRIGIRYLALDEAHCVSQWGHDFRPSYLNIVKRLKRYDIDPVRIALTATASPKVREDLCEELELINAAPPDGHVLVVSSNRQELNLIVRVCRTLEEKADFILDDLRKFLRENEHDSDPGAALVFMPHAGFVRQNKDKESPLRGRKSARVTGFAEYVEKQLQTRIAIYNGKMDDDLPEDDEQEEDTPKPFGDLTGRSRKTEQNKFISGDPNKGDPNIMIATKGFGMGIDKPNIRLVIHRTTTSNLEAYAQEAGRAGRDRHRSNVILYYSPDSSQEEAERNGKVRSDHDIQSFFIDNKYVRREDVLLMRAFLRTVTHNVNKRLYFTSDQAVDYFETQRVKASVEGLSQPYEWPEFPSYEAPDNVKGSHFEILQRGHEYRNKKDYVRRILGVMYRIRPDLPTLGKRLAIIESAQEVPIYVRQLKRLHADRILRSNDYFGHLFREKGITAEFLQTCLQREQLLTHLAEHLGISIYETSEILKDIQYCDGYFETKAGRETWVGELLDIWVSTPRWVDFPNPYSVDQWRQYAGAYKRAVPQKPKGSPLSENDWFPDGVLNQPVGWEVELGAAFYADEQFEAYLNTFMQIHDERQRSDWDSYNRLLTEYVGVNTNGSLRDDSSSRSCLRAAMLGYLKSYEVVVGGNCYSCSVCVPDGNFDRYTDNQRQNAVVSIGETTQISLDNFETYAENDPPNESVQQLLDLVHEEEKMGRSLKAYVQSWSARLLQDTPGHRGALWLRAEGAFNGEFNLDIAEVLRLTDQISKNASAPEELLRADDLIERLLTNSRFDRLHLLMLRADTAQRRSDFYAAYQYWHLALQERPDEQSELPIRQELIRILDGGSERSEHLEQAGWLTDGWNKSADFFSSIVPHLEWAEVENRIDGSSQRLHWRNNRLVFVWVWLRSHSVPTPHTAQALTFVDDQMPEIWLRIPANEMLEYVRRAGASILIVNPKQMRVLANTLQRHSDKQVAQLRHVILLTALNQGLTITGDEARELGQYFAQAPTETQMLFNLLPIPPNPSIAAHLIDYFEPTSVNSLNNWIRYFPVETMLGGSIGYKFLTYAAQVIQQTHIDISSHPELHAVLAELRAMLSANSEDMLQVEQLWYTIAKNSSVEYVAFAAFILQHPQLVKQFEAMWTDISAADLGKAVDHVGIDQITASRGFLSYLAKQMYRRSGDNERSIAGELILCGLKRGMSISDASIQTLCNLTFNRTNSQPFIHDPLHDTGEVAIRLLRYFKPIDIWGLMTWLQHFPVESMKTDPNVAATYLISAAEVIINTHVDISEQMALRQPLYQLRAYLLSNNIDQAWLEQTWENIIAFSPNEKLELVLLRYESGGDISAEFAQYVLSTRTEQDLASLIDAFQNRNVKRNVNPVDYISFYLEQTRQSLQRHARLRTRTIEASDIEVLGQEYKWQSGSEYAAMFAVTLDRLRRHYNPNWLTPIAFTVEAYARAGLFENAEIIAAECEANGLDLRIGKQPIEKFMEKQHRELQKRNYVPAKWMNLYQHIATLFL